VLATPELYTGLNLRRDKLADYPVAMICFLSPDAPNLYAREVMDKMPDLWSFRSLLLELNQQTEDEDETTVRAFSFSEIEQLSLPLQSTLGGTTRVEKLAELERLQQLVQQTDSKERALLRNYWEQIQQLETDLGHYQAAITTLHLLLDVVADDAGDTEKKEEKATCLEQIGALHSLLGQAQTALTFFERSYSIWQELHQMIPDLPDYKYAVGVACSKLGETYVELDDSQKALSFFERYYTISQDLYLAFPDQVDFKHGIAVACERLGGTYLELGDTQKALSFFERNYTISQELYLAFPDQVDFKYGIAVACAKLGDTHTKLGDTQKALSFFEHYYTISQELHLALPDQVNFKNGFAIACAKLGDIYTKLGDTHKALTFFERDYVISQELQQAFPDQVTFKNGFAVACAKLGETYTALGNTQQAQTYFQQAETLWQALVEQAPLVAHYQRNLTRIKAVLANL
jgi:tetratricopeptide (TPR) repeat protein